MEGRFARKQMLAFTVFISACLYFSSENSGY